MAQHRIIETLKVIAEGRPHSWTFSLRRWCRVTAGARDAATATFSGVVQNGKPRRTKRKCVEISRDGRGLEGRRS